MKPKYHIFIGFLFSLIFYLIFPSVGIFNCGIIFLSTFLIDVDHYFYYSIKERDFNLRRAYSGFLNKGKIVKKLPPKKLKEFYTGIEIFHGLEWVFIFSFMGFYLSSLFYFIALGIFFHLILDWINQRKSRIYPRKFSIICDIIAIKNKKLTLIRFKDSNKV